MSFVFSSLKILHWTHCSDVLIKIKTLPLIDICHIPSTVYQNLLMRNSWDWLWHVVINTMFVRDKLLYLFLIFPRYTVPSKYNRTPRWIPLVLLFIEDIWVENLKMSRRQELRFSAFISCYLKLDVANTLRDTTFCIRSAYF